MPRGSGRPCELTPAVQRKICKALADGNVRDHAARAGGITRSTLFRWISKGRRAKQGKYCDFWHAVEQAEDECARRMMASIQKAARGFTEKTVKERTLPDGTVTLEVVKRGTFDPAYAKWWLGVRFPQLFADPQHRINELEKQVKELLEIMRGQSPAAGAMAPPAGRGPGTGERLTEPLSE